MRRGRKRLTIPKGKLVELYVNKKLNSKECAKELGCSDFTVLHRLDEFGIERRKRTPEKYGKRKLKGLKVTYKLLHQDYVVKGLSTKQCGEKYGCSSRTVLNRMKEVRMACRKATCAIIELPYKLLHQNYVGKGLTGEECGRIFGCSESTIIHRLEKFGIERRDKWHKSVGIYNLTILERDQELAATPSILYFIEIWCGTGVYWRKFGITTNSIKKRLVGLGYEYSIIETTEGTLLDCYKKEQELLTKFADKQSKFGKEIIGYAGGCTEVFNLSKKDINIALVMFESYNKPILKLRRKQ